MRKIHWHVNIRIDSDWNKIEFAVLIKLVYHLLIYFDLHFLPLHKMFRGNIKIWIYGTLIYLSGIWYNSANNVKTANKNFEHITVCLRAYKINLRNISNIKYLKVRIYKSFISVSKKPANPS